MKIIDCHGHIFPHLWEACGFESAELHLLFQKYAMHLHGNQPVRRQQDQRIIQEKHLWDPDDPSESGQAGDVRFRVGRFGRYEWKKDGQWHYLQFLPPHLQEMCSPPEFIVTQMDYVGIETMVLQNDHIYGNLAEYFSAAIKKFPGRFIGLAQVEEAFAYRDDQMAILAESLDHLGMKGLYFTLAGFFRNGYKIYYTDPEFRPFWNEVEKRNIPVFWVFFTPGPMGDFADEMVRFLGWLERYPNITSVLVHGMPTGLFAVEKDRLVFPSYMTDVMDRFPVYSEILYPIGWGGKMNFPFERAQNHIRQVYDRFGPDHLLWGSDMPNIERYCTYRQTLTYILDYCDFITAEDREKIFQRNTLSLFGQ